MENYNYADEIIKDYDNQISIKIEEPDILQSILKSQNNFNAISSQDKIKGFMEGLKTDNTIINSDQRYKLFVSLIYTVTIKCVKYYFLNTVFLIPLKMLFQIKLKNDL